MTKLREARKFPYARAERVRGSNIDEWRKNISPEFWQLGDAVIAWVNEGDLYFDPPQREWQGLTDEEREAIDKWIEFKEAGGNEPVPAQKLVTYVESKLREKNSK